MLVLVTTRFFIIAILNMPNCLEYTNHYAVISF